MSAVAGPLRPALLLASSKLQRAAYRPADPGYFRLEWPQISLPLTSPPIATGDVTGTLVKNRVGPNFADTIAFLEGRLGKLGYQRKAKYKFGQGVIIITPPERVADDGRLAPATHRWVMGKIPCSMFSFGRLIRNIFFGDDGRFRELVFLISDEARPQDVVPAATRRTDPWGIRPSVKPPANRQRYARPHLWMMVYEYRPHNGRKWTLVENRTSPLPFGAHAKWLGL